MTEPVVAVRRYRNNSELIAAAAQLGHLKAEWLTADVTYGKGTWWRTFRPNMLVASDLYPDAEHPCDRQDATALPYEPGLFRVTAIDPPYKLNGTDQGEGSRYGVGEYSSVDDRHKLMRAMLVEGARVTRPSGRVLFKCQDQVCAGRLHWQTFMAVSEWAPATLRLVEKLDYQAGRPQPDRFRWNCKMCRRQNVGPRHACSEVDSRAAEHAKQSGRRPWLEHVPSPQEHAYMRPSTLLIFQKAA